MNTPEYELLIKSHNSPGLCSKEEIDVVNDWLKSFNHQLIAYKRAFGEPSGLSVEARIETLEWYQNREE